MIEPFQVGSPSVLPQNIPALLLTSEQTTFAVPMTCEDCAKDISESIHKLPGNFPNAFAMRIAEG